MQNPNTNKELGIKHGYDADKFRDIRQKALFDEVDRHKKYKRNKKEKV
jgi:hypothetical protein